MATKDDPKFQEALTKQVNKAVEAQRKLAVKAVKDKAKASIDGLVDYDDKRIAKVVKAELVTLRDKIVAEINSPI